MNPSKCRVLRQASMIEAGTAIIYEDRRMVVTSTAQLGPYFCAIGGVFDARRPEDVILAVFGSAVLVELA